MIDLYHTANENYDLQLFAASSAATLTNWQVWNKPAKATMIYMLCVGGASSGQNSANGASATNWFSGGAGGGSGAQSIALLPAFMVPDTLFIQAGQGGYHNTASYPSVTSGGVASYVSIEPFTTLNSNFLFAFANPGGAGGTAPTNNAGGIPPAAAAVATLANMCLAGTGFTSLLAGLVGQTAAGDAASANIAFPTSGQISFNGTSGGTSDSGTGAFAGGAFTAPANLLGADLITPLPGGTPATTTTNGANGMSSIFMGNRGNQFPLYISGGMGGGGGPATTNTGVIVAGSGGSGQMGGGGGGGAGFSNFNTTIPAISCLGGDGGGGYVLIASMF